jgi:hypothetical protein
MVEAVEVFSDGWIEHLKHPDPESYIQGLPDAYESLEQQRTVHRWIGISWVLTWNLWKKFQFQASSSVHNCSPALLHVEKC